jgi:hypothetical protein
MYYYFVYNEVMNFDELKMPEELMKFCENNLEYGFVAEGGEVFKSTHIDGAMNEHYKLCINDELADAGHGLCWDFVELQRAFFEKQGIKHESFWLDFLAQGGNTHTFTLFNQGGKCKWFEYSWAKHRGIHEYPTKQEALQDICLKAKEFAEQCLKKQVGSPELFRYPKAEKKFTAAEFVRHCKSGERINLPLAARAVEKTDSEIV